MTMMMIMYLPGGQIMMMTMMTMMMMMMMMIMYMLGRGSDGKEVAYHNSP